MADPAGAPGLELEPAGSGRGARDQPGHARQEDAEIRPALEQRPGASGLFRVNGAPSTVSGAPRKPPFDPERRNPAHYLVIEARLREAARPRAGPPCFIASVESLSSGAGLRRCRPDRYI